MADSDQEFFDFIAKQEVAMKQLSKSLPILRQLLSDPKIQDMLLDRGLEVDMKEVDRLYYDCVEVTRGG